MTARARDDFGWVSVTQFRGGPQPSMDGCSAVMTSGSMIAQGGPGNP